MKTVVPLIIGLSALTACTTTSDPNTCNGYERGRLKGLEMGASINTPDPNTEEGRKVLDEIAFLRGKCSS